MDTDVTLSALWELLANKYAEREAIHFMGRSWSFEELFEQGNTVAAALIELGIQKGDRVCVWMPNGMEWLAIDLGITRAGGVLVPLNTRYTANEVEYILKFAEVTTLFMVNQFHRTDYIDIIYTLCPELNNTRPGQLNSPRLPNLKNVICLGDEKPNGAFSFAEFIKIGRSKDMSRSLTERQESIRVDDPAKIFFTSGTTSFPKGAMLLQHLWKNMNSIAERIEIQPGDRVLVAAPMFYILGNLQLVFAPLLKGACVHPVERFDPELIFGTIDRNKCTILDGVPTMYQALLESRHSDRYDLTSLRTGRAGGAPMSLVLVNAIIERLHIPELHAIYGLTECTGVSTATHKGDLPQVLADTIGTPLPDTDVRIVNPETGKDLPTGETGELWIRGHMVTSGYMKQPEETKKVLTDGWFHTGDLMRQRAGGCLEFIGRSKDIIKRGGENVSPPEVENCISRHPAVDHVEVVGMPDEKFGEVGVAFVKQKEGMRTTEKEILDFCAAHLAKYKIPAHARFIEEFPQTATGKIQKFKLREKAVMDLQAKKEDQDG